MHAADACLSSGDSRTFLKDEAIGFYWVNFYFHCATATDSSWSASQHFLALRCEGFQCPAAKASAAYYKANTCSYLVMEQEYPGDQYTVVVAEVFAYRIPFRNYPVFRITLNTNYAPLVALNWLSGGRQQGTDSYQTW